MRRVGGEESTHTIDKVDITFCDYGVHGHTWQNNSLLEVNLPDKNEIGMVPLTFYDIFQSGPGLAQDKEKKAIFEAVGADKKTYPGKVIKDFEDNKRGCQSTASATGNACSAWTQLMNNTERSKKKPPKSGRQPSISYVSRWKRTESGVQGAPVSVEITKARPA